MKTFFWYEVFVDVAFGQWTDGVCTKEPTAGVQLTDNPEPHRLNLFLDINLNENRIINGNHSGFFMPKNWIPA